MLLAVLPASVRAAQPEAWADAKLKITAGLTAWYDASVENAARKAAEQTPNRRTAPPSTVGTMSRAIDTISSSPARLLARSFASDDDLRFVRFDGADDALASDGWNLALDAVTVFVVAAPFSNDGFFRGLLAANAAGANDYVTGLNVDLGPEASGKFATLNVEGAGFGGAQNLKQRTQDVRPIAADLHHVASGAGGHGRLFQRPAEDRHPRPRRFDVQARSADRGRPRFTPMAGPPETRGFLCGEIAEVLDLRSAARPTARTAEVDRYLQAKYGELRTVPMPARAGLAAADSQGERSAAGANAGARFHRATSCRSI